MDEWLLRWLQHALSSIKASFSRTSQQTNSYLVDIVCAQHGTCHLLPSQAPNILLVLYILFSQILFTTLYSESQMMLNSVFIVNFLHMFPATWKSETLDSSWKAQICNNTFWLHPLKYLPFPLIDLRTSLLGKRNELMYINSLLHLVYKFISCLWN